MAKTMVNEMEPGVVRRYVGIMTVELSCQNMFFWGYVLYAHEGNHNFDNPKPYVPPYNPSMKRHPVIS